MDEQLQELHMQLQGSGQHSTQMSVPRLRQCGEVEHIQIFCPKLVSAGNTEPTTYYSIYAYAVHDMFIHNR